MKTGRGHEGLQTGMALVLLVLALVGIVLSFPIKMGDDRICLLDRRMESQREADAQYLLDHYVASYAFVWWGSALVLGISIYPLYKRWNGGSPFRRGWARCSNGGVMLRA